LVAETVDARERIWAIAKEEFAAKGLAGARVDEIARRAAVNKAMIYYYFKSKENLLRQIIGDFFGELLELKRSLHREGCMQDESYRRQVFAKIYSFLRQRKPVIRIILREMAKGEAEAEEIILWFEPVSDLLAERLSAMGFKVGPGESKIVIQSTFFGLVPLLMYVMLEEKIAGYLGMDVERAVAGFHEEFSSVFDKFCEKLPGGAPTVRRPAG
jgi:AcrR family transcriptional regulator